MINWLSDRSNITFLIAVVGFVISIYNFISGIIQGWVRLDIEIADFFRASNASRCVDIIHVKIVNRSKVPVIISRVILSNAEGEFPFGNHHNVLLRNTRRVGGVVAGEKVWTSDYLPIKIEGNGYANLLLKSDKEIHTFKMDDLNTFKFYTDKRIIKAHDLIKKVSDFSQIEQCREPDLVKQ